MLSEVKIKELQDKGCEISVITTIHYPSNRPTGKRTKVETVLNVDDIPENETTDFPELDKLMEGVSRDDVDNLMKEDSVKTWNKDDLKLYARLEDLNIEISREDLIFIRNSAPYTYIEDKHELLTNLSLPMEDERLTKYNADLNTMVKIIMVIYYKRLKETGYFNPQAIAEEVITTLTSTGNRNHDNGKFPISCIKNSLPSVLKKILKHNVGRVANVRVHSVSMVLGLMGFWGFNSGKNKQWIEKENGYPYSSATVMKFLTGHADWNHVTEGEEPVPFNELGRGDTDDLRYRNKGKEIGFDIPEEFWGTILG